MKILVTIAFKIAFIFYVLPLEAQLRIDAGEPIKLCINEQLTLGGDPTVKGIDSVFQYVWSPAAGLSCTDCANPMVSPTQTTTYYLMVTDQSGNEAMDSVIVELTDKLEILTPNDLTLCREGACIELKASVNGGIWEGKGVDGNLFCPLEAGGGNKTLTYTVNNHPVCAGSDSIIIKLKRKPNLDISVKNDTICLGTEIIISNNSPEKEKYEWFINENRLNIELIENPLQIDITDNIFRTGTYTIVQQLIKHPCETSDTLVLTVKRQANFGFDLTRTGPCGRSYYIKNTSADESLTYNWSFGNGEEMTIFQPDTIHYTPALSGVDTFYFVSIAIEDPICEDTEITSNLYVGYRPLPEIISQRISIDTLCTLFDTLSFNSNLDLNDVWLDSLQWKLGNYGSFNGNNLISNQLFLSAVLFDKRNLTETTTDTITLITYGRCGSDSSSYVVNLNYQSGSVRANFETEKEIYCVGDTIWFNNLSEEASNYFWDFDNNLTSNDRSPYHIFTEPGEYTIQLTAAETCSSNTITKTVAIISYPINTSISYLPDEPLTLQTITLIANAEEELTYSYQWNLGILGESSEMMPELYYREPGEYMVFVTLSSESANCPVTLSTKIPVAQNILIFDFFATAFSPNADGINDCYPIDVPSYIELELFQIYDRWGKLVFETNVSDVCWNGKSDNKAMPIGVYAYQAFVQDIDGEEYNFRGNITLVR